MNARTATQTAVALLGFLLMAPPAIAATLHVANHGVDSGSCGSTSPCRSITQAITNAAAGDTVLVGPGLYSNDVDLDTTSGEPGEEPATGIEIPFNKRLTVLSTDGAWATQIVYTLPDGTAVDVNADGSIFGRKGKGFSVNALDGVRAILASNSDGRIEGNIVSIQPDSGGIAGSYGIYLTNADRTVIRHNRIFCFENSTVSAQQFSAGIGVNGGSGIRLERNVVFECGFGFFLPSDTSAVIVGNAAVGNSGYGFGLNGTSAEKFERNLAAGNGTWGVTLTVSSSIASFQKNTFTGNGFCGVQNNTGAAIDASRNFWGTSTGPGPDPADDVCNVSGTTITTPFLVKAAIPKQAPLR